MRDFHAMELHLRRALVLPAAMLLAFVDGTARTSAAEEKAEALGAVDFNVSCAEASRPAFDRALALMHHMMSHVTVANRETANGRRHVQVSKPL